MSTRFSQRTASAARAILLAVMALFACSAATAQPNLQAQLRQERQNVTKAEKRDSDARLAWDKSQQELKQAETAQKAAEAKLTKLRQEVRQRQAAKLGLAPVLAERDAAASQAKQAREAALAALQEGAEYQAAATNAETASEQLRRLSDDKTLPISEMEKRSSALSVVIRRPIEMQKEAVAKDERVRETGQRLAVAQGKLAKLQQQIEKAVEADGEVAKARSALKLSEATLARMRKTDAQTEKDLSQAEANLAHQRQILDQTLARERRGRP